MNTELHRDSSEYDVVICGGGLVGACMAIALSQLQLRIAVVEARGSPANQQASIDERATAISYVSQRTLSTLGLWRELAADATPIRKVHVSERGRFGVVSIGPEYTGGKPLGYVLINRAFSAVLECAMNNSTVELLAPATFEALHQDAEQVKAKIRMNGAERELKSRLLIAADGVGSRVRSAVGIQTLVKDYHQTAILTNITPEYKHENIAYERFTNAGPLAVLPLDATRCKTVWTARTTQVGAILALSDDEFLNQLQTRFGERLGRFSKPGKRQTYPLRLVQAARQRSGRVVIMGNAAHSLHPVAAQGFNLSLRDVATLADGVADALSRSEDIGNSQMIENYVRQRQRDQSRTVALTDGLNRVFSTSFSPLVTARSFGQLLMDLSPPLKRRFVRHNLGLTGYLPRLARGLKLEFTYE